MPYLVGASFTMLSSGYVTLVTLSAFTLIGIVATINGEEGLRLVADVR